MAVDRCMNNALTKTTNQKHIAILRIIAGAPLFAFGLMHLTGMMPMKPLIEAAGLPMPGITAMITPPMMILAGLLLLIGAFARIGAVIGIGTMLGAVMTHIKIPSDAWPIPAETAPNPDDIDAPDEVNEEADPADKAEPPEDFGDGRYL